MTCSYCNIQYAVIVSGFQTNSLKRVEELVYYLFYEKKEQIIFVYTNIECLFLNPLQCGWSIS